jgi:hypothetical protein
MSHRKVVKRTGKTGILILLATLAFYTLGFAPGIAITVTGSWSLSIGQADLQGAAGSDLTTYYESATTQLTMAISGSGGHTWRVDVKRVDSTWHGNFGLSIKRTNGGTSGTGSLYAGGTEYGLITTSNQTFWTGIGDRAGIYLQEKLDGVSCAIPAASYSTTIYFTVVQTN